MGCLRGTADSSHLAGRRLDINIHPLAVVTAVSNRIVGDAGSGSGAVRGILPPVCGILPPVCGILPPMCGILPPMCGILPLVCGILPLVCAIIWLVHDQIFERRPLFCPRSQGHLTSSARFCLLCRVYVGPSTSGQAPPRCLRPRGRRRCRPPAAHARRVATTAPRQTPPRPQVRTSPREGGSG